MYDYHNPVLLHPSVDALVTNPDGTYVDVTFGGGGHSRAILNKLSSKGKLISFDQDEDTLARAPQDPRFTLVNHNFQFTKQYLEFLKASPVDGILADLGISSHQIDVGERGFAHRLNGPLDMRMSASTPNSAADIVQKASEKELNYIFKQYGEIPNARRLTEIIIRSRGTKDLSTIDGFKNARQIPQPSIPSPANRSEQRNGSARDPFERRARNHQTQRKIGGHFLPLPRRSPRKTPVSNRQFGRCATYRPVWTHQQTL
jgi:16S rRNA (cytosine(1402)-N(4))-methyltransferase